MVTAKTQYNLANARSYFEEHLCVGDYYDEGQRLSGQWFGQAAEQLGLSGNVQAEDFLSLCDNRHPTNGERLTQRHKSVRREGEASLANRRIFFDFTFATPKSVSVAALIGNDERISASHERAVRVALRELECFAGTRIRVGGAQRDRSTGNILTALFTHDTSRALDPHVHTHCVVFNATFDPVEKRWKALQNHEMLLAKKYAANVYYHELVKDLRRMGYGVENDARGSFRISGISEDICERFSKRHREIDVALDDLLTKKPELASGNLKELRSRLAEAERARKQKDIPKEDLRPGWEAQLTREEQQALRSVRSVSQQQAQSRGISAQEAVAWAEEHLFDRRSVVSEHELWLQALARARGGEFELAELKRVADSRGYLRNPANPREITLPAILARESEIVRAVRDGLGERHPLVWDPKPAAASLDEEQHTALSRLMRSTDAVAVFRGGAGTGKSFVLSELARQVAATGRPLVVLAPQRQQVEELTSAGFPAPQTVSGFLRHGELVAGAVIVVDEAGQIGGRQMLDLVRLVQRRGARLLLSGDTRQHGPVEGSDAMVAIERYSGVQPIELRSIRRQDPARARDELERRRIAGYRKAVEAAAKGELGHSFDRLQSLGAIVACEPGAQSDRLADEYVRLAQGGASSLVISQTWTEVHRINAQVRVALKSKGLLGETDTTVQTLDRIDLTTAQKRDQRFYPANAVIVFNQPVRSVPSGSKGKLAGILKTQVLIDVGDRLLPVANRFLDRISVCAPREILVAPGERIQIKANRRLRAGGRVSNGELVTVKTCRTDGSIELTDGRVLDQSVRELLPGYAVTSYGSQGKTVENVLFSDSAIKSATNAEQWYVSISRGRRGVQIFTPDPDQLRQNIVRSGHRKLALDFAGEPQGIRDVRPWNLWHRLEKQLRRFGSRVVSNLRKVRFLQTRSTRTQYEHQKHRLLERRSIRPSH